MIKKELIQRSPIRILEKSIHGGLGKGNLGVFTARKGVGKTACLVHVAVDKLLRDQKVLHISFADDPHHIESCYNQVFNEAARAYGIENVH
jgi:KaiC/GvpD/RAD55 family RecA-like ATPase